MDVYCPKCTEPWDTWNLRIDKVPCDNSPYYHTDDEGTNHKVYGDCEDGKLTLNDHIVLTGETSININNHSNTAEPQSICLDCATDPDQYQRVLDNIEENEDRLDYSEDDECVGCHPDELVWCSDGLLYYSETCETCHEVIPEESYQATLVICNSGIYCIDCAEKHEMITDTVDCPECKGTGEMERGGDAMEPHEIRRFKKGEGCPACDFGLDVPEGVECQGELYQLAMEMSGDDIDGMASTMELARMIGETECS